MTTTETKEDLKITDEEMDIVRRIFNQDLRPFSEDNNYLFGDPSYLKSDIPVSFRKLRNATTEVSRRETQDVSRVLIDYMWFQNSLWMVRRDSGSNLIDLGQAVLSLSKVIEQEEEATKELLDYHRLCRVLAKANSLLTAISREKV
ncbi:MAG: hypothetical protein WD552_00515 [Candidatus Paceibacterota bacterium]